MTARVLERIGFAHMHRWFCHLDGTAPLPTADEVPNRVDGRSSADYRTFLGWRRYFAVAQAIRIALYAPASVAFLVGRDVNWCAFCAIMSFIHVVFYVLEIYQASIARLALAVPPRATAPQPRRAEDAVPSIRKFAFETTELYRAIGVERFGKGLVTAVQRVRGVNINDPILSDPTDTFKIIGQTVLAERVHGFATIVEFAIVMRALQLSQLGLVAWVLPYIYLDLNLVLLQRMHRLRLEKQISSKRRREASAGVGGHA